MFVCCLPVVVFFVYKDARLSFFVACVVCVFLCVCLVCVWSWLFNVLFVGVVVLCCCVLSVCVSFVVVVFVFCLLLF